MHAKNNIHYKVTVIFVPKFIPLLFSFNNFVSVTVFCNSVHVIKLVGK